MAHEATLIAVPVYNEQEAVVALMDGLNNLKPFWREPFRVLFVDDGSDDATPSLLTLLAAENDNVAVVTHPENLGLGAAVGTIIDYALASLGLEDALVTMDGDDTHDPQLIPEMVRKLREEGLDFVVASRFARGGREIGLKAYRRLLSRGASAFCRLFFPIPNVRDYSSGFRAYRVEFLRRARSRWGALVTTSGFDCMAEILAKASRMGPAAGECPLVLRYDRKRGKSKMRILRTIGRYLRLLREAS